MDLQPSRARAQLKSRKVLEPSRAFEARQKSFSLKPELELFKIEKRKISTAGSSWRVESVKPIPLKKSCVFYLIVMVLLHTNFWIIVYLDCKFFVQTLAQILPFFPSCARAKLGI